MADEEKGVEISKPLSLLQLAKGPDGERFDLALEAVIENALDLNRSSQTARAVTLTLVIKPIEAEIGVRSAGMQVSVATKLAPLKPTDAKIVHFGRRMSDDVGVAMLIDPGQLQIFQKDQPADVVPISSAQAEGGST